MKLPWRDIIAFILWLAAAALILHGGINRHFVVLDKPLSVEAARQGVKVLAMSEMELTTAVSTDQVELSEEGILQTRPSTGFCET
jgi:hypothetical protein